MAEHSGHLRWYDRDPVLRKALGTLHDAADKHQAQVALNIIKIIVEHQMEASGPEGFESSDQALRAYAEAASSQHDPNHRRRWYDVNETLRSSLALLHDCPDDLQRSVIPSIALMIEKTLREELVSDGLD
jgi:hypothetical protein